MTKVILAALLSFSSLAMACPKLEGSFSYSGKSTIDIIQYANAAGVMTFDITVDDHVCAVCKYDIRLIADGKTVRRDFPVSNSIEYTTISCGDNRLKYRRTTEFYDDQGKTIASDSEDFDYRVNANSDLVMEIMQNEEPIRKSVYKRLK